jgi:glycosyltransferase involved in cell wall biosynthesis
MKIGIVCPYSLAKSGGVQNQVAAQAAELARRGHTVRVITPRPQGYAQEAPAGTIFIGQSARIRTPQHTSADVSGLVNTDVIDQMLAREQFEVLHVHEPLIPMLGLQLLNRVACPAVGTFHAALPDTFLAQIIAGSIGPYKRSIFKRLAAMTAVAEAATSYLGNEVDREALRIIPNGITLAEFRPAPGTVREPATVLYVGRLEKRKGVRYLLEAFAVLQKELPEARLVIIGDGPERAMLETRLRQLKLREVTFLGQAPDEVKRDWLARCTVFTAPALYGESFGIVLLEAMAAGAVTVAGVNRGYEAVLAGTGRLSLVDPKATVAYARRLALLMTDQKLRTVWQEWAAETIPQYDFAVVVDKYEALYRDLAPGSKT